MITSMVCFASGLIMSNFVHQWRTGDKDWRKATTEHSFSQGGMVIALIVIAYIYK